MPRYAIKQERALHTIYRDAETLLDAVNGARRALIDHATHGELVCERLPDNPDVYDQERETLWEQHPGGDRDDEVAVRWGLERADSPVEAEPWP